MKRIYLAACLLTATALVSNAQETKSLPPAAAAAAGIVAPQSLAEIAFDKDVHDFGTIEQGANGTYEFKFKNTGKEPLIISNAQGSCGCTVPVWPKEPVKPYESSVIKVTYDTKRVGAFTKTVTLTSNAKSTPTKVITIKGVVNAKPVEETMPVKKVEGPLAK
ncbi:MAG: DUF1573 domain-containing protein [Bacteroidia bacterium]